MQWLVFSLLMLVFVLPVQAAEGSDGEKEAGFAEKVTEAVNGPLNAFSKVFADIIFYAPTFTFLPEGAQQVPIVLILLAGTAIFLTIFFGFINVRAFWMAINTVRGKYTRDDAPGSITHFQALSAALSATVGLGNIAGVAVAIGVGGPGATLWMILLGICGMTTKFTECTLGVRYRKIDDEGNVQGGAMQYLTQGLHEGRKGAFGKVMKVLGMVLAVMFAVACVGGALGAGNLFQSNQAYSQLSNEFGSADGFLRGDAGKVTFGVIMAFLVGVVIIGGIKSIAKVTSILVPMMCMAYVAAGIFILFVNADAVPAAMVQIFESAMAPTAVVGGLVGALIQGVKRAAFSNEAGIGSAPIAHSAVKTDKPASEGLVALLEPAVDTVVVCTMTALVIVVTGEWNVDVRVEEEQQARMVLVDETNVEQTLAMKEYVNDNGLPEGNSLTVDEAVFPLVTLPEDSAVRVINRDEDTGESWGLAYASEQMMEQLGDQMPNLIMKSDSSLGAEGVSEHFYDSNDGEMIRAWLPFDQTGVLDQMDITKTSAAFGSEIEWFPVVLTIAVVLFAFSTMLSWSYYGEQAVVFLCGGKYNKVVVLSYKLVFCVVVILGAILTSGAALSVGDSFLFAMVAPNLIGLFFLLPRVRESLTDFMQHARAIDRGEKTKDDV